MPSDPSVFLVLEPDLLAIERVAKRLFTEERLKNGDEYRDLAQTLDNALRRIRDWRVSQQTADIVVREQVRLDRDLKALEAHRAATEKKR
jgi:hypothetical protein